jgi:hypothetical protein
VEVVRESVPWAVPLPEGLTAEVMRRLVQVRLEAAPDDLLDGVCLRCGLQYPLPQFPGSAHCGCGSCEDRQRQRAQSLAVYERLFDGRGCPACGASTKVGEMNWAHLVEDGYWFAPGRASTGGNPCPRRPSPAAGLPLLRLPAVPPADRRERPDA